ETYYLFPPRWARALSFLVRHPWRLLAAVTYALQLRESSLTERLKTAALIPSATDLVVTCREEGINHIHIHSFANALHVGALANILGSIGYSATLHGDLPVYGRDHADKLARASFVTAVTAP